MSGRCDICQRTPGFGHRISHSHHLTNRRWNLNIQRHRMIVNGVEKPLRVCTRCLRTELKKAVQ